jgi:hypothetical protein
MYWDEESADLDPTSTLKCCAVQLENHLLNNTGPWDEKILDGHELDSEGEEEIKIVPNRKERLKTLPRLASMTEYIPEKTREQTLLDRYDMSFPTPEDVRILPIPRKHCKGVLSGPLYP